MVTCYALSEQFGRERQCEYRYQIEMITSMNFRSTYVAIKVLLLCFTFLSTCFSQESEYNKQQHIRNLDWIPRIEKIQPNPVNPGDTIQIEYTLRPGINISGPLGLPSVELDRVRNSIMTTTFDNNHAVQSRGPNEFSEPDFIGSIFLKVPDDLHFGVSYQVILTFEDRKSAVYLLQTHRTSYQIISVNPIQRTLGTKWR